HNDKRGIGNARDRRDVADKIEAEIRVERRVDRAGRYGHQERVTVRRCSHDEFGGDIAAEARPVLNHELLAEALRQPLTREARDNVGRAAGWKSDNKTHRPRRLGLRPCDSRHGRERGSARSQMQDLSTVGKFHFDPSLSDLSIRSPRRRGRAESSRCCNVSAFAIITLTVLSRIFGTSLAFATMRIRSSSSASTPNGGVAHPTSILPAIT